jgi:hypothetical protein
VFSGIATMTRSQERTSLLLLLHWLKSADEAASLEWVDLRCHEHGHAPLVFPTVPDLTAEQKAIVQLSIDVVWRAADPDALAFLHQAFEANDVAQGQSTFLFHPSFHRALCTFKTNHRHLLVRAANELSQFLS